jgi:hypothetical protein
VTRLSAVLTASGGARRHNMIAGLEGQHA